MSTIPSGLKYTQSHEWIELADDDTATIGITDHAQSLLGDLVYVEIPDVGQDVAVGEACAVVESVKAASDIYSPFSGEVLEANEELADTPELINTDPYDAGWIFKVKYHNKADLDELMDADAYAEFAAKENH